MNLILVVMQL